MRKIALAFVFVLAVSFPLFAGDFIGMDLSVGVGANKDFMDAGITAADLSVSAGLSLFPIRFEDFAAGITIRATIGSSIVDDSTFFGWYALTPLLTLVFLDEAPMSISGGYGPTRMKMRRKFISTDLPSCSASGWARASCRSG